MNIVVLDGHTRYSRYIDWTPLAEFGNLAIYDYTPPDRVIERAADADVVLINGAVLDRETIERLPRLKYIGLLLTGYDSVDVEAATKRGIVVTNVRDYGTLSVAQMVFAHLLNLTQRVDALSREVRAGEYGECVDELLNGDPLRELFSLKMGIVGFGNIGQATARLALAFGMDVLAHDARCMPEQRGVRFLELDALFSESDVVSLHCPLTEVSRGLVDRRRLELMKPDALLINTSRGAIIDEEALAKVLNTGRIAGAGLDVLCVEPPPKDHPLLSAKNCVVTPHVAAATRAAWDRHFRIAADNLKAFLDGRPQNVLRPAPIALLDVKTQNPW